ncbi:MAG TPA: hypothetical protein VGG33_22375 [Polyangia bacterium]
MKPSFLIVVGFVAGIVGGIACGDEGTKNGNTGDVSQFCTSLCTRQNSCDSTRDVQTCTNQCKNNLAVSFPKLRGEVVNMVSTCTTQKDCKTILLAADVVLDTCSREAAASLAPTATATSFCDAVIAAQNKCTMTAVDRAACLELAKRANDPALEEAKKCSTKACADIVPCLDAALPIGTPGQMGGGNNPPPAGAAMCGGQTAEDACEQCLYSKCCTSLAACAGSTMCQSIIDCIDACATDACIQQCAAASPQGAQLFSAFGTCVANNCDAACQ